MQLRRGRLRRLPLLRRVRAGAAVPVRLRALLHLVRARRPARDPPRRSDVRWRRSRVTNTGEARRGGSVVQLYVGFPASPGEPPESAQGFRQGSSRARQLPARGDDARPRRASQSGARQRTPGSWSPAPIRCASARHRAISPWRRRWRFHESHSPRCDRRRCSKPEVSAALDVVIAALQLVSCRRGRVFCIA